MLVVARGERLIATQPRVEDRVVAPDSHEGESEDGDAEITRTVVVRRRGLATVEDLAGYLVRAMDKTPDGLHPTRALAQIRGPVRTCESDAPERREARRIARATIAFARKELKRCYAERLLRDPRVIIKQPVGLVLEQALRFGFAELELDIDLEIADGRAYATGVHSGNALLYEEDIACFGEALGGIVEPRGGVATQVPVVLWTQPEDGAGEAAGLSLAAAVFGWLELERNANAEALALFEDAAWLYRLPEYQVLLGLAHERLGHPIAAARAYRKYLAGRPGAPDAKAFEARLEQLATR